MQHVCGLMQCVCVCVCVCVRVCVCVSQVYEFLIRLHSADSSDEEEVFPYIRTLLHFDTREFLNVLAMVRSLHIMKDTTIC